MTRLTTLFTTLIVAGALAVPITAHAQAQRRGGGSGGSSSGGSASGGSSSSGGSSGGGSVAVPRVQSPRPSSPSSSGRAAPARVRSSGTRDSGSSGAGARSGAIRSRDNQAIRGTAVPRGSVAPAPRPPIDYDDYYRWRSWYPSSYWGYSYVGYSPWRYGYGPWGYHRYGWYDPFWYGPWSTGYGVTYWPSGGGVNYDDDYDDVYAETTGSIRLRVDPDSARVYVDGALAGVAGEFGGFSDHLDLPAGRHQIELRADGYAPTTVEVEVEADKVRTTRVNLDRVD